MLISQVADLPTTNRPPVGSSRATIPPGHIATTVGCAGAGNACFCVPVSSSARGRMLADAVRIPPQREGPAHGNGFTVYERSQVTSSQALHAKAEEPSAISTIEQCADTSSLVGRARKRH